MPAFSECGEDEFGHADLNKPAIGEKKVVPWKSCLRVRLKLEFPADF